MPTFSIAANAMPTDEPHYLRKELYDLLRDGPEIFDFIQGGSLDGIWYWDLENPTEEWMSERFWTTLGYDPNDRQHKADAWQDIIFTDDLTIALENFEKHCADATHPYDQIVRYRHSDGSTVWIRCRGLALRDEKGRPLRMLGAHTDITALKVAEEQLARKNRELEAANQSLARFAYAASHDLQSPIKSLNAVLDVLAEDHADQLDPTGLHVLSLATDAGRRVESLTAAILDYSKTGTAAEGYRDVDCGALLRDIRTDLAADLERSGVALECGPLPVIRAVPSPIRQLFQNLVGNAIKFRTRERGTSPRITVRATELSDGWRFSVSDNGIGIAASDLDAIFDPFRKLHKRSEYGGAGLGLALCWEVVRLHRGSIWAESEPGEGTTFNVTLPDAESD